MWKTHQHHLHFQDTKARGIGKTFSLVKGPLERPESSIRSIISAEGLKRDSDSVSRYSSPIQHLQFHHGQSQSLSPLVWCPIIADETKWRNNRISKLWTISSTSFWTINFVSFVVSPLLLYFPPHYSFFLDCNRMSQYVTDKWTYETRWLIGGWFK